MTTVGHTTHDRVADIGGTTSNRAQFRMSTKVAAEGRVRGGGGAYAGLYLRAGLVPHRRDRLRRRIDRAGGAGRIPPATRREFGLDAS